MQIIKTIYLVLPLMEGTRQSLSMPYKYQKHIRKRPSFVKTMPFSKEALIKSAFS